MKKSWNQWTLLTALAAATLATPAARAQDADVTIGGKVQIEGNAYRRSETATVWVEPVGGEHRHDLVAVADGWTGVLATIPTNGPSTTTVQMVWLEPGNYELKAIFYTNDVKFAETAPRPLVVGPAMPPAFPCGLVGDIGVDDETLATYHKRHFTWLADEGTGTTVDLWSQEHRRDADTVGSNEFVVVRTAATTWDPEPADAGLGGGGLDFVFDREWARQEDGARKPLWAWLGSWSGDLSGQPDWATADFRLGAILAVAKGCTRITWTGAAGGPLEEKPTGLFSHPGIRREIETSAAFLYEKGAMLAQLERRPYKKTAVLWYPTADDNDAPALVFAGLRNIGACPDLVSPATLRAGGLKSYDALALCDADNAPEDLWPHIDEFAATAGKIVFHDESCTRTPTGSVALGADCRDLLDDEAGDTHPVLVRAAAVGRWAKRLRTVVTPKLPPSLLGVTDPSGQVGPHLLWADETPYLFIVNTDLESTRSARVRMKHGGRVAYDLWTGRKLDLNRRDDGWIELPVRLRPGGVAMYMLPPDELAEITATVFTGTGDLKARISLVGRRLTPLPAAAPIYVELVDAVERITSHGRYVSTDGVGTCQVEFHLGKLTDAPGRWSVNMTDLLTRNRATARITVRF